VHSRQYRYLSGGGVVSGGIQGLAVQAMAVIPLVISVVFGLLVSTVLILVALPALYAILEDLGWARNNGS
tara:strand:- start:15 stop:224 length:210 start_codon:yes stop_codon:yes gene_type:complete